jgi:hypothetical protein
MRLIVRFCFVQEDVPPCSEIGEFSDSWGSELKHPLTFVGAEGTTTGTAMKELISRFLTAPPEFLTYTDLSGKTEERHILLSSFSLE